MPYQNYGQNKTKIRTKQGGNTATPSSDSEREAKTREVALPYPTHIRGLSAHPTDAFPCQDTRNQAGAESMLLLRPCDDGDGGGGGGRGGRGD